MTAPLADPIISADGFPAGPSGRPSVAGGFGPQAGTKKDRALPYGGRYRPLKLLAVLPDQLKLRVGPNIAVDLLYEALAVLGALL
jgi:hypothetical protein